MATEFCRDQSQPLTATVATSSDTFDFAGQLGDGCAQLVSHFL